MNDIESNQALYSELAVLVKCKADDVDRIVTRVVGIGVFDTCSRCGGCGQYSYCAAFGKTCFKCSGSGKVFPRSTKALVARVAAAVAEGKLVEYFRVCAQRKKVNGLFKRCSGQLVSGSVLACRAKYAGERRDLSDPWTAFTEAHDKVLHAAYQKAYTLLGDIYFKRKPVTDAAVDEAVGAAQLAEILFHSARKQVAARPEFCAALLHRANDWNEFFTEFWVLTERCDSRYFPTKFTPTIVGALNLEDLILSAAQRYNLQRFTIAAI